MTRPRFLPSRVGAFVLLLTLGLTALGTWATYTQYNRSESRILYLRVQDAGGELAAAVTSIQTPLASADVLADATGGDPNHFRAFLGPYVGTGATSLFVSASLWNPKVSDAPLAVIGAAPDLAASPAGAAAFFAAPSPPLTLHVTGVLGPAPRIGYAYSNVGGAYTVYAEGALPPHRRIAVPPNSSFAGLDYAIYLGRSQDPGSLIATSYASLPVQGRQASVSTAFGTSAFTLVMSSRVPLTGTLSQRLSLITAVLGGLLALIFTLLAERLVRRRRHAEDLAVKLNQSSDENRRLYTEQRTVAETLQLALLPEALPELGVAEAAVRYLPGVEGVQVGGDWYDVIPTAPDRLLIVVGDVSGRGVPAAGAMASLLHAIRAYAVQGDPPEVILPKLSRLINLDRSGQFATALLVLLDLEAQRITLANAGHLPPLLLNGSGAQFIRTEVGLPVGVSSTASYNPVVVPMPSNATLLAFTDGLVERRDENIDDSLDRLRRAAGASGEATLDGLLGEIVGSFVGTGAADDTVLLGVRWKT